jgi:DNA sulfur modification protein DndD
MFLRKLGLVNYGLFKNATFDLTTDVDHPIVLVSGNNGAGKTSFLEALRVALHGRRAFDVPLGEAEYLRTMANRFHTATRSDNCAVSLEFDHVDMHKTHHVELKRSWVSRGQRIMESLEVMQDGISLGPAVADDLLNTIVPPEIAKYFFFDGERIRELAEWESEDESALFSAVADLLGLGILNQLRSDLLKLSAQDVSVSNQRNDPNATLVVAEERIQATTAALRSAKVALRGVRSALDRARAEVRRLGVLQHDELVAVETELAQLSAEKRGLQEEAQRAAGDVLPLLCARTLRLRFSKEIETRRQLEDREIVTAFILNNTTEISAALRAHGLKGAANTNAIDAITALARGSLLAVSASLPNLSRSDSVWMQRVIERELPEIEARSRAIITRLRDLDERIGLLETQRRDAPIDDSTSESALRAFELAQRMLVEQESRIATLEQDHLAAETSLVLARDAAKAHRFAAFREGRMLARERIMNQVLECLPTLSSRLQASKEERFASYLESALQQLWNKTKRLAGVEVSFSERRIALLDAMGELRKSDLSAGEKQLFAIAFIYALAKLSGRLMPFVIDTPLGRLDHQHRRRFVSEFLPSASHQVILLSTDTEIVGSLYQDIRPLLAHHHELADYNEGATSPVAVGAA